MKIIAILNTTPDSYFDGGKFNQVESAVRRAGGLLEQGADIIEIGGESTGPGSNDVTEQEEIDRTIPIIKAIKEAYPAACLSVDTYKSAVARAAIENGVTMVNDVTAGRGDSNMFSTIATTDVQYVMMYAKDTTPRTTTADMSYTNVVQTIYQFLEEIINQAIKNGIRKERIIIDPGLGHFVSSDPKYSFELIKKLDQFLPLGEVFISPSRKSFLAGKEQLKPADRLPATIAASAIAVLHGATYIRTHDVAEVRRGCEVAVRVLGIGD